MAGGLSFISLKIGILIINVNTIMTIIVGVSIISSDDVYFSYFMIGL